MKSPEHRARQFDWKLVPECATNRCDGLPRDGVLRRLDQCPSLAGVIDFQPSAFSLRHCRFDALTPAEIQIVEGTVK